MIARTWRLADGPGPHASDGFQLARPSGRNSLVIRIVPLKPKIAALAVLVCDPETRTQVDQSLLHQVYRLTRTEARLVIALAQGERLEGAAQTLGVTLGTGRTYLKRVFHKMGVSRQVDLMRLVLCGPTQFLPRTDLGAGHSGRHRAGTSGRPRLTADARSEVGAQRPAERDREGGRSADLPVVAPAR